MVIHNHPYFVCVLAALGRLPELVHQTGSLFLDDLRLVDTYDGEIDEYAQTVTTAVVRNAAELDRRITEAAEESGWTADRLGAVERNILRIAIHELDAGEIPSAAVIDEAVTLAKQYSTREAGRLVNGILDRINKEAQRA